MRRTIFSIVTCAALGATGCADYAYRARTTSPPATAQAGQSVREQAPPGQVSMRSAGIEPLPASTHQRALHLVLTVANVGTQPWRIDTRREAVVLPDGSERAPVLALTRAAVASVVEVPPRSTRTVDLYYALPGDEARASRLPRFSARWEVETGHGPWRGETTFRRVDVSGPTMPCGALASAYCLAGYGA